MVSKTACIKRCWNCLNQPVRDSSTSCLFCCKFPVQWPTLSTLTCNQISEKQKEKFKQSIFVSQTKFVCSCLPYVINHPKILSTSCHFTTELLHKVYHRFLLTLLLWTVVSVIRTSIKLYSLGMSIIISSLKEISSNASECKPMLNIKTTHTKKQKQTEYDFSLNIESVKKDSTSASTNQWEAVAYYTSSKLVEKFARKWASFSILIQMWPWMKVKVIQIGINCRVQRCLSSYKGQKILVCKCPNTSYCSFFFFLSFLNSAKWTVQFSDLNTHWER